MNDIIFDAMHFATVAHLGQVRKGSGLPYVTHPINVARFVSQVTNDPEMIAAALLHDVIEDTKYTYDDILKNFGQRIADLVNELTDKTSKETHPHLSRADRRGLDHARLAGVSDDAKTIKLADIYHNVMGILDLDSHDFALLFLKEKIDVLPGLVGGNKYLHAAVSDMVARKSALLFGKEGAA